MPLQTGKNVSVAYKEETTFNVAAAGGGGAKRFRLNSGGLTLGRATIAPNEIRSDMKTAMGRLGSRSVSGSYAGDLSVGTFDDLIAAVLRGSWVADVAITQGTATSITTGANTIVRVAGSWLTDGVKVGDVGRLTGHSSAANNDKNLRVTGVTALTLTVAETLVVDAVADATFTFTVKRTVSQPVVPERRSFTFEEYYSDIDLAVQYTGVRVSSLRLSGSPDSMATLDIGLVGADGLPLATGTSPYFTSPTLSASIGLTLADATLRFGGVDVATLTGFDLSIDNRQGGLPIIGGVITPDIFENSSMVSGSVSGVRSDFTNLSRFLNETELEFHALLVEPEVEPKDFVSVFLPRIKLTDAATPLGGDGAMIETLPFMVGNKEVVTGYDDTMVKFSTSAA